MQYKTRDVHKNRRRAGGAREGPGGFTHQVQVQVFGRPHARARRLNSKQIQAFAEKVELRFAATFPLKTQANSNEAAAEAEASLSCNEINGETGRGALQVSEVRQQQQQQQQQQQHQQQKQQQQQQR